MCLQTYDAVIDDRCPQKKPFVVVRCIAHQHVGSQVRQQFLLEHSTFLCMPLVVTIGTAAVSPW